ncbi:NUDIX hydrolase [Bacillus sp. UNCCL13]|uniref:NUDIX hydrolase n=1 Tax=Bacillus sp. UNCCL13 TaxID=1502772 RepID=UPI0034A2AF66
MVDLKDRGWDFPGGHIELGEEPEACFKRETLEEAYVEGHCELLGYIIVDHSDNNDWIEDGKYPKVGYQVFYKMSVDQLHGFDAQYESTQRILIDPNLVSQYHHKWNTLYQEIFDACTAS